jgi:hypothetical protein
MNRTAEIGCKVAGALLLYNGEISKEDIRSLRFFENYEESEIVIEYILTNFDVEVYTKKITSEPIPQWEEVIRLKT